MAQTKPKTSLKFQCGTCGARFREEKTRDTHLVLVHGDVEEVTPRA